MPREAVSAEPQCLADTFAAPHVPSGSVALRALPRGVDEGSPRQTAETAVQ
jgi:hypothetical protein